MPRRRPAATASAPTGAVLVLSAVTPPPVAPERARGPSGAARAVASISRGFASRQFWIRQVPSGCWQAVPTVCCGWPPIMVWAVYSRQVPAVGAAEAGGAWVVGGDT
jgi:hypothetical protein